MTSQWGLGMGMRVEQLLARGPSRSAHPLTSSRVRGGGVNTSESPLLLLRDSVFTPQLLAPVAALDCAAGAAALEMRVGAGTPAGGHRTTPTLSTPNRGGQTMGDYLVLTPVADLKWDDVVVDKYGPRRIIEITRDYGRAFIDFNTGPSGWYLNAESLPVEVMS